MAGANTTEFTMRVSVTGEGGTFVADCVVPIWGRHFDVAAIPKWPLACNRPGISIEFIKELCWLLHWRCPVTVVPGGQWGGNSTGEWSGIIRRIMDGETDAGGPDFNPIPSRQVWRRFPSAIRLHWRCPVTVVPGGQWGGNSTGEWSGIIRRIMDGETDAGGPDFNPIPSRQVWRRFPSAIRLHWRCPVTVVAGGQWGGNSTGEWSGIIRRIMDGETDAGGPDFNPIPSRQVWRRFPSAIRLHWRCPVTVVPGGQWGGNSTGEWSGIIRRIMDGETDAGGPDFNPIPSRQVWRRFPSAIRLHWRCPVTVVPGGQWGGNSTGEWSGIIRRIMDGETDAGGPDFNPIPSRQVWRRFPSAIRLHWRCPVTVVPGGQWGGNSTGEWSGIIRRIMDGETDAGGPDFNPIPSRQVWRRFPSAIRLHWRCPVTVVPGGQWGGNSTGEWSGIIRRIMDGETDAGGPDFNPIPSRQVWRRFPSAIRLHWRCPVTVVPGGQWGGNSTGEWSGIIRRIMDGETDAGGPDFNPIPSRQVWRRFPSAIRLHWRCPVTVVPGGQWGGNSTGEWSGIIRRIMDGETDAGGPDFNPIPSRQVWRRFPSAIRLHWRCPVTVVPGGQWGGNSTGEWSGIIRRIMDGETDAGGPDFNPIPSRQVWRRFPSAIRLHWRCPVTVVAGGQWGGNSTGEWSGIIRRIMDGETDAGGPDFNPIPSRQVWRRFPSAIRLHWRCPVTVVPGGQWGGNSTGEWSGIIRRIMDGETDAGGPDFNPIPSRQVWRRFPSAIRLHWRCPVTVVPGGQWGGNSTGEWSGIIRRIMDGETDAGGPDFNPIPSRQVWRRFPSAIRLHWRCPVTVVPGGQWGGNSTGEWSGIIRRIMDGETDAGGPDFNPIPSRQVWRRFPSAIRLHWRCPVTVVPGGQWGGNSTGEWSGIIRRIMDGETDAGGPDFNPIPSRQVWRRFPSAIRLHWRCPVTVVPGGQWGGNSTGEWSGIIRRIMDGETDAGGPDFNPIPSRQAVVEFTDITYATNVNLLTMLASSPSFSFGAVLAFNVDVWCLMLLCVLCLGAFVLFAEWVWEGSFRRTSKGPLPLWLAKELLTKALNFFCLFLSQGAEISGPKAVKLAMATWALGCVILIGTYSSFILVSALNTAVITPFEDLASFAECVEEGECQLSFTSLSTALVNQIANAKAVDGDLFTLKKALEKNPIKINNIRTVIDTLQKGTTPLLTSFGSEVAVAQLGKGFEPCSLYVVRVWGDRLAMPLANGFPRTKDLNRAIKQLQNIGVATKLWKDYILTELDKQATCDKVLAADPINIWAFVGSLVLFGVGVTVGGVAALGEVAVRRLSEPVTLAVRKMSHIYWEFAPARPKAAKQRTQPHLAAYLEQPIVA